MDVLESESKLNEDSNISLDTSWKWQSDSFKKELEIISEINQKNLCALKELEGDIRNLNVINIENPIQGQCDELKSKYLEQNKNVQMTVEEYKPKLKAALLENTSLKKKILFFKEQIASIEKETEAKKKELIAIKKDHKDIQKALTRASKYYQTNFNIKVETEDKSEDTYIAKLYFYNDKTNLSAINFLINRSQSKVLEFDASAVLTTAQEAELKEKFANLDNIPALVCQLRKMVLKISP